MLCLTMFTLNACDKEKETHTHTPDSSGFCTVCNRLVSSTEGIICEISEDGTYAIVVGYEGLLTDVNIADTYRFNIANTYHDLPITTIAGGAFIGSESLTSIEIPASVTSIGDWAFYSCSSLTSLTFGENSQLTSIGDWAFSDCYSLSSIEIPNSVTSMGEYAFFGCESLTSAVIGKNVTNINLKIFNCCNSLTNLTIVEGNEKYHSKDNCIIETETNTLLFGCKNSIIPNYVTSIGNHAFSSCHSLTSIEIPDSVITIGDYAFNDCTSLTSVTIGNNVTDIGVFAFWGCNLLENITLGNSVKTIGDRAFECCNLLTSIELPISVTTIGKSAFNSCNSLTNIELPNSITSIGDNAFSCCNLISVIIPKNVITIGNCAFDSVGITIYCENETKPIGWDENWYLDVYDGGVSVVWDCANNEIAEDGYIYAVIDGIKYGLKDGQAVVACQQRNITMANIPSIVYYNNKTYNVTSIGLGAFSGCTALTIAVISNGVTSIGDNAFSSCESLSIVIIPNSVIAIGNRAFSSCDSLVNITIPNSVTSIGSGAFSSCNSLTNIIIPDSITSIGDNAFSCCRVLEMIEIPSSVTSIGDYAFDACTKLRSIKFKGTMEQWDAISKGFLWDFQILATKVICTDGEVSI